MPLDVEIEFMANSLETKIADRPPRPLLFWTNPLDPALEAEISSLQSNTTITALEVDSLMTLFPAPVTDIFRSLSVVPGFPAEFVNRVVVVAVVRSGRVQVDAATHAGVISPCVALNPCQIVP